MTESKKIEPEAYISIADIVKELPLETVEEIIDSLPYDLKMRVKAAGYMNYKDSTVLKLFNQVRNEIKAAQSVNWMRALTLQEPWASMVAKGEKTIETRKWPTKYRGDVLITVSKTPKSPVAGKAIAIVKVVDCRPMEKADEVRACCEVYPRAWSWVLEDIRAVYPFPVKGRLGLWTFNYEKEALRGRQ